MKMIFWLLLNSIFLSACSNIKQNQLDKMCSTPNSNHISLNEKVLYICHVWDNDFKDFHPKSQQDWQKYWYSSNEFTKNMLIEFRKENKNIHLFTQCNIGGRIFATQNVIDACQMNYQELLKRNGDFISNKIIENQSIKNQLNQNNTPEYFVFMLKNMYFTPESRQKYLKPILEKELIDFPKSEKLIQYIQYHLDM